ncbi:hypothetical protein L6164_024762 [Bauhinia variegata]|uniref:Uncharacterized protein n=1 Tax=Bauhinia variegata TaxID=167791 RepID=A0ACB9LYI7_BAUVA|nr:hypothetical protein L6164_024762 [Bauhinia variegata]
MTHWGKKMQYENYDPSFPDQPVVDLYLPVWATLPSFQSKPAFIWAEDGLSPSFLTYAQLNASVHLTSYRLLKTLQRGDTVVVLCTPGLNLVEILFGCQRAGLLTVPVIPPHPSFAKENYHHLIRVLSQTKPKAAVAHSDYIASVSHYVSSTHNNKNLANLLQNTSWISIDEIKESKADFKYCDQPLKNTHSGCKPDEVYLIQYTSAATGIPKPVLVTAGSAAHNVRTARKAYDLHPNSVIVSWLPQYYDCGLVFLLLTIVSGGTCVLASPTAFVKRPRLWLELVSEFKGTCTPVPSFTLPLVVKRGGIDKGTSPINLSSLNNLILINEPIYRESVEEFVHVFSPFGLSRSAISPSYGLAENCTFVSTAWRGNSYSSFPDFPTLNKLLPVVRLSSRHMNVEQEDMNIVVVNEETLEPVEDGIEGEIWVSSPSNGSGYLGHPSLTRDVFRGRLRNQVNLYFLRTGDRGIVRGEQRYLFVTGRCQDIIKLQNGQEIHPHYIETAAYKSCPELLRGGCLASFKISTKIVLVAELRRVEKDTRVLRSLCEGIQQAILKEANIEIGSVVLVKSGCVPKTTSGKLQRWAAKEKLSEGKMIILMQMQFGNNIEFFSPFGSVYEHKQNSVDQERRRQVKTEEKGQIIANYSLVRGTTRTSLLSGL